MTTTPQPHVLLLAGDDEVRGVDTVAVERIDPDTLMAALRPDVERMDVRAIRAVRQRGASLARTAGTVRASAMARSDHDRDAARHSATGPSRAAERASVYGWHGAASGDLDATDSAAVASTWPAPGELATLRRRVEAARVQLAAGRHAPGIRHLRQAIGGLARRASWSDAADGAVSLAGALLHRGRARDAQSVLDEAQGYAVRAGCDRLLIDIATLAGDAWVSLARLDEAERVLGAALAAAKAAGDCAQSAGASLSLARCLFWRGQYADAQAVLGAPPDGVSATLASRHARLASRIAVGRADLRSAMSTIADAKQRYEGCGDPGTVAAHCGYSRIRSSGGRRPGRRRSRRCRIDGGRAGGARSAARTESAAPARRGRTAARSNRMRPSAASAADTYESDVAASPPYAVGSPGGDDRWRRLQRVLRRQIASTGLKALALYLPPSSAAPAAGSSCRQPARSATSSPFSVRVRPRKTSQPC